MAGKALLVAAMFLVLGLAGCIGASTEDNNGDDPEQNTLPDNVVDENETKAPEGRGDISAFQETNRTEIGKGGMMHSHDYWKGETRKEVMSFNSGLIPLPLTPPGKAAGTAIADYDIPEPGLVWEGTDHLELVMRNVRPWPAPGPNLVNRSETGPVPNPVCCSHPAITIHFDYLTALDEPGNFRYGGQLIPEQPFLLKIKPTEADMPHQQKSLWVFRIYTGEANGFSYNLTLTAVKGNAIPDWPPHPDLYAERSERKVLETAVAFESKGWAQYWLDGSDGGWAYPERVISYGTDRVEIFVENVQVTTNGPAPTFFNLEYHTATHIPKLGHGDPAEGRILDEGSDGTSFHFTIPIEDATGFDTPYGQKSRWGFRLMPRWDGPTNTCIEGEDTQQFLYGCQWFPYSISYNLRVVAFGHSETLEDEVSGDGATNSSSSR